MAKRNPCRGAELMRIVSISQEIVSKGHHASYKIKHANILLKADLRVRGGRNENSEAFGCHPQTVRNLRERLFPRGCLRSLGASPAA